MIKPAYILLVLTIVAFIAGCETERDPCLTPRSTLVRAGAYRRVSDTGTAVVDTSLPSPVFTALTTFTDTNTFIQLSGRNKFTFQLSDLSDTCRWVLRPDSAAAVRDTITFYYQRQLHFISNACGYNYYFYLQRVSSTRNAIDSIIINNTDITSNASAEHIKIYF